jgi:hypothetical protein
MILKVRIIIYSFLILVLFNSCTDPHKYSIDPAFTEYLQRFENEAASRGRQLNPKSSGLIIEFGALANNDAGLTHYETPIRIQIDKAYWDDISKSSNADLMKENLIFHELGHGLLGRDHLNTTLENGDWSSIMCGGTVVDKRPWNINYRGIRRSFYVDELFNKNTPKPSFSSMVLQADTTGYSPIYQLNFNNPQEKSWTIVDDAQHTTSLDNGRFKFQSKIDANYLLFTTLSMPIYISSNFSYELTFYYPTGDATNFYGLAFGPPDANTNNTNNSAEYFVVNNNQKMQMGNRSCYSFFTQLNEPVITTSGINKLKVFKIGTFIYYFINNTYCYMSELTASNNLNLFGFIVPPQSTLWLDNFSIAQNSKSAISAGIKQNIQVGFDMLIIDKFIPNKVKGN